jgi:hypothetical protein
MHSWAPSFTEEVIHACGKMGIGCGKFKVNFNGLLYRDFFLGSQLDNLIFVKTQFHVV